MTLKIKAMWKLWRPEIKGGIHICGCGHSGTSILTRLVGAHSLIHALPGETGIAKKERYSNYRAHVLRFEQEASLANSTAWAEKTPKHIRNLGFILDCAPSTKVVLITRNPKDTVASLKRRYGNLGKSIRRWKSDNTRVLHWSKQPQCIVVQYENLITNTEDTMTEVMTFFGYIFEPDQLNFHEQQVSWYQNQDQPDPSVNPTALQVDESQYGTEIHHNNYRNYQINQPLFSNIGTYRKYLTNSEAAHVWKTCGRLALALGYRNDDKPAS